MYTVFDESDVDILAEKAGYKKIRVSLREKDKLTSYVGKGHRVDVFMTTGTVSVCLDKPKAQDPTVMFRRNMTSEDVKKIFDDPKVPLRKAYHRMSNGEKEERFNDASVCKFR